MFASSYPNSTRSRPLRGSLYQQVGVETGLAGASSHQVIAMLFDGYLEAIAQARGALAGGDHAAKGLAIGRAVRIVEEGLRAGLNLRAGGALARDLDDLYGYLSMRLTLANLRNDDATLDECQRLMQPLREAWMAIADSAHDSLGTR
jgi:flagellar protein FliS